MKLNINEKLGSLTLTRAIDVCQYLKLDEKDFRCLVRGGILHVGNLRIVLSDIGFDEMQDCIESAILGKEIYKDHIKESI